MRSLEQLRAALHDRKPEKVASECGVHFNTVREIQRNPDANPTWRVMQAINAYLDKKV